MNDGDTLACRREMLFRLGEDQLTRCVPSTFTPAVNYNLRFSQAVQACLFTAAPPQ